MLFFLWKQKDTVLVHVYLNVNELQNRAVLKLYLQSRDSDDARNSGGGQEVKSRMHENEESLYCTGLDTITEKGIKQKVTT